MNYFFVYYSGGNITYHGGGQLVIYPLFDLRKTHFKKDLYWYLRKLEMVVMQLLNDNYMFKTKYGYETLHDMDYTGVWVKNGKNNSSDYQSKISAIGIGVSRWKTYHGMSFNVNTDLTYFNAINPCGINEDNRDVINLVDVIGNDYGIFGDMLCNDNGMFNQESNVLIDNIVKQFNHVFGIECIDISMETLLGKYIE